MVMASSPEVKVKRELPENFERVTRNRSKRLAAESSKEVKIILNKISPSQLSTNKKSTSFKPKIQAGHVTEVKTPPSNRRKSMSAVSKRQKNLNGLVTPPSASTIKIELIDLSSPPSATKKKTPPLPIKHKKQLNLKKVPVTKKTKVKKQTVSASVVKKARKVTSVKTKPQQIKTQPKSKVSRSVSVQTVHKGSKNCCKCAGKEVNINLLQCRIKELEDQEGIAQRRLKIYEGLGLNQVEKEEENKVLLKKKEMLEMKLSELERERNDFVAGEEEEINTLLRRKNILEKNFMLKVKESEEFDRLGEEKLKQLKENYEKQKETIAQEASEVIKLAEEFYALKKEWVEKRKEITSRPEELPQVKETLPPCEICKKIRPEKHALQKELEEAEKELQTLKAEVYQTVEQMVDGACDVTYHEYEVEYMKKRIDNERNFNSECEKTKRSALSNDYNNRNMFTDKVCKMMTKKMCNKRYFIKPKLMPMPRSHIEECDMQNVKSMNWRLCCSLYPPIYCQRFLCGKDIKAMNKMSDKEKDEYEKTLVCPLNKQFRPGSYQTAEFRRQYIDQLVLGLKGVVQDRKLD